MTQDIHQDTFDNRAATRTDSPRSKIIFVGSAMSFSERILAVFRAEFSDYDFFRISTIADVSAACRLHDDVQLVVFEAPMMQSALDDTQRMLDAVGSARIIFSLLDPQDAARFLFARSGRLGLKDVGFLPLNGQMDVWISVMHLFLCGQSFLPQDIADLLINDVPQAGSADGLRPSLTVREWEVLQMVALGKPNKIIADDMDLSVHTVKLHIHNLLKKIGVSNRTCAANWFIQNHNPQVKAQRGLHG